jgi:hypothetical protein
MDRIKGNLCLDNDLFTAKIYDEKKGPKGSSPGALAMLSKTGV